MQTYVEQMPLKIKVVNDYYDVFSASVLSDNYSDPQVSIDTYIAAFADTLESFRNHDVNDELPKLMARLLDQGANAGLGGKQITSLINLLSNELSRYARSRANSVSRPRQAAIFGQKDDRGY